MRRYEPRNPLQAVDPQAFLMLFAATEAPENVADEVATVVTIRGPLSQHDDWWEDSYEAIRRRVEDACQQTAPVVVLSIDSPGGDVAGLFDTARAIRAACDRAGKRLMAHIEGDGCSAGYALAAAAEHISASRTAKVGSIGVIAARVDESRALEEAGIKVSLITSGARKGDGWPVQPMTRDELAAFQADIDGLAAEFFEFVSVRRGISTEEIAAMQAASFRGSAAVKARLVDGVGSFDHLLASLGAGPHEETMDKKEEARKALQALAEDEECSEEERESARRALAALDGDEEESAEDEEKPADEESAEDEPAEEEAEGEEDDEEAKAAATPGTVSASTAGALAAHGASVEKRLMALERRHEAEERDRLIAAHGGVPKGMAKLLASKPLSEVKAILAELPKPKRPKLGDAAATATVGGTRGAGEDRPSRLPPDEARAMKRAMGLEKPATGVVTRGNVQIIGCSMDEEVR